MNPLFLIVLTIHLTGCVVIKLPYVNNPTPRYLPQRDYTEFRYDKFQTEVAPENDRETKNYLSHRVVLTTPAANERPERKTTARYLESKTPGKKKMVIVVPIYGSSEFPPQMLAITLSQWYADADYNVILLKDRDGLFDWKTIYDVSNEEELKNEIGKSVESIIEAVRDIRRMVDWAWSRPEIDQKRIGVVGFSIGAITASLAMGTGERISGGVLVTGAGNPAYILSYSQAKFIAKPRRIILKRLDWTQDVLFQKISPQMRIIDPVSYGKNFNPERILILEAMFDEYLPQSTRENLWLSLRRPERIILPYGHKTLYLFSGTVFGLNYLDRTIAKFFDEKL